MNVDRLPPAPETIEQSGVGRRLLFDLILKLMHVEGLTTVSTLSARSRLPIALISELVDEFRELTLLESLGTQGRDFAAELRYALTSKGHEWAVAALQRCHTSALRRSRWRPSGTRSSSSGSPPSRSGPSS